MQAQEQEQLQVQAWPIVVIPMEVLLLLDNVVKDVFKDKSFDYLINNKDKYDKYDVVYQLQNLIHLNECKYYKICFLFINIYIYQFLT